MKIRNRLTVIYALTAFSTMAAGGIFIYWFSARFHHKEFYRRLEERVEITEKIFLEKNEAVSQAVREKFLHSLDEEQEFAMTLKPSGLDSLNNFSPGLGKQILRSETAFFSQNGREGVCKRYHLPAGEYAVVVTAVDVFGQTKLENLRRILLTGTILGSLVLTVIGYWTTGRALLPLESKIHKARRIGADRLDLRLEVENPDDELGELAFAFNSMLDRLQSAFEAQRRFVSNASHELRNPLTAIIGQAEVLLTRERSPQEYQASVQIIQTEAERLERLTNDLFALASSDSMAELPSPQVLPLDELLLELLEKFPAERLMLDIAEPAAPLTVLASPSLLTSAINNLVDNAFKYSGDQPVTVSLSSSLTECLLKVTDMGIGIPAAEMGYIYQPLFRAQNARGFKGAGIGLPLAKKIIELHGGQLEVHSEEGRGTTATVFLKITLAKPADSQF